ncbi:MAG: hypothetical protein LBF62_02050 [Tannerellaceae bacterium]|jgi:hypothetical protein|nr:hypothetical protein [Tannerellaceae bacterium]
MRKNIFLLTALFISLYVSSQVDVKSGLIAGSGSGSLYDTEFKPSFDMNEINYKAPDVALGYRFRLQPSGKRFFYDADILVGLKRFDYARYVGLFSPEDNKLSLTPIDVYKHSYFHLTLGASWNYRFVDKWYAGVGINPTLYAAKGRKRDNSLTGYSFDIPAALKLGYDFGCVDVSFNYAYGFSNVSHSDYITKARLRNWQIQFFIPF